MNNKNKISDYDLMTILRIKRCKTTTARMNLLMDLRNVDCPMSTQEIVGRNKVVADRATVYRMLKTFTKLGILHLVSPESVSKDNDGRISDDRDLNYRVNYYKFNYQIFEEVDREIIN